MPIPDHVFEIPGRQASSQFPTFKMIIMMILMMMMMMMMMVIMMMMRLKTYLIGTAQQTMNWLSEFQRFLDSDSLSFM